MILFDSLSWLRGICKAHDVEIFIGGRVALGVVDIRLCGSVESQALVINQFRKRVQNGDGSAVLRRAETALRNKVDPWGNIENKCSNKPKILNTSINLKKISKIRSIIPSILKD